MLIITHYEKNQTSAFLENVLKDKNTLALNTDIRITVVLSNIEKVLTYLI